MQGVTRWGLLSLAAVGWSAAALAEEGPTRVELTLVHPEPGIEIDPQEPAFLAGEAYLRLPDNEGLDAVLALDASASTGLYAHADVNDDGLLDRGWAGSDSVFAAEVRAAVRVVDELARPGNRVALVIFAGSDPARPRPGAMQPAGLLVHGLSGDFASVRGAVEALRGRVPRGMTNMQAGLDHALRALGDDPRRRRDATVLLFSDGAPTSPYPSSDRNLAAALDVAERCRARGVRVHTFAIGSEALESPEAPIRIADATGGYFTPVERATDLADLASWVARASIQRLTVHNRTSGDGASHLLLDHDGSWSALVPLQPGRNVIEVAATALGGLSARREVVVVARSGAPDQAIPERFVARREALLRQCLGELQRKTEELKARLRRELALEMEHRVRVRKELRVEPEGIDGPTRDPR